MTNCELDVEIAKKVFGKHIWSIGPGIIHELEEGDTPHCFNALKAYSTDLNEAFRVVEKMREKNHEFLAYFKVDVVDVGLVDSYGEDILTCSDASPARAICLCALRVIEEMENQK